MADETLEQYLRSYEPDDAVIILSKDKNSDDSEEFLVTNLRSLLKNWTPDKENLHIHYWVLDKGAFVIISLARAIYLAMRDNKPGLPDWPEGYDFPDLPLVWLPGTYNTISELLLMAEKTLCDTRRDVLRENADHRKKKKKYIKWTRKKN